MKLSSLLFAAALVFTALPDAHAQSGDDWWEWAARSDRDDDRYDDDDYNDGDRNDRGRYDRDRYEDRDDHDKRKGRKKGPKFCRNGEGHPTKGMRWCYDKGFATRGYDRRDDRRADRRDRRAPRWERRSIEDIIFRTPRRDRDRRPPVVRRGTLGDIFGRTRFRQLERAADGPISARWVYPSRTVRVLQLRDRHGPLAELTDFDGDGRVDRFLANSAR